MIDSVLKRGGRVIPGSFKSREDYLVYLRHLFAYEFAKSMITENSFVLEVGCGEGYGTNLLSQHVRKITGLDIDRKTITHASKKYHSENCVFEVYDGVRIPYNDHAFDAVISFQVIEHLQNDMHYVSEIHRVLGEKGNFILTTPNRTFRLRYNQKPWNRFHVREYYPHELENVLKNKFSDVKVWGICGNEEVQRIEIERVEKIMNMQSLDYLNLRKLIPISIEPIFINIFKKITGRGQKGKNDADFPSRYSLDDFYVIKNNVRYSLDLLGICRK